MEQDTIYLNQDTEGHEWLDWLDVGGDVLLEWRVKEDERCGHRVSIVYSLFIRDDCNDGASGFYEEFFKDEVDAPGDTFDLEAYDESTAPSIPADLEQLHQDVWCVACIAQFNDGTKTFAEAAREWAKVDCGDEISDEEIEDLHEVAKKHFYYDWK